MTYSYDAFSLVAEQFSDFDLKTSERKFSLKHTQSVNWPKELKNNI